MNVDFTPCGIFTTKVFAPTNKRGTRIKAIAPSGKWVWCPWNNNVDPTQNHANAAAMLACEVFECEPGDLIIAGGAVGPSEATLAWAVRA